MYCSSCGAESTPGLNYCNRCGASLSAHAIVMNQKSSSDNLTRAIFIHGAVVALITLFGFIALIKGATELAKNGFSNDPVMLMLLMGMLTILVVDICLIRQMSRLVSASIGTGSVARAKEIARPKQTSRQLNARPEPAASVTENTTRTFEPVYRESKR